MAAGKPRARNPGDAASRKQLREDFLTPRTMKFGANGPASAAKFLTVENVARQTQFSVRQVRRWIAAGDLPAHKIGSRIRIDARDLALFLFERRHGG